MLKLISPETTANRLKIHQGTLRNWRHQGKGPPFVKIGGKILYDEADLKEWIEALKVRNKGE